MTPRELDVSCFSQPLHTNTPGREDSRTSIMNRAHSTLVLQFCMLTPYLYPLAAQKVKEPSFPSTHTASRTCVIPQRYQQAPGIVVVCWQYPGVQIVIPHIIMQIAEEWLSFEKEVLGTRPLFTGTVEECRSAYQATSDDLAPQYPKPGDYEVDDRR